MNKTRIDWANSSWNPITGCYHTCQYCYARRMANRFKAQGELIEPETYRLDYEGKEIIECNEQPYTLDNGVIKKQPYPYGFTPCLHRYRFAEYQKKKGRNIFVGSMADIWGSWVPDRWIAEILMACEKAPQHNYLFLTKNPTRYIDLLSHNELPLKDNYWYGATVNTPGMVFNYSKEFHTFLSIEPILTDFGDYCADGFVDWVIVGAETGNRQGKIIPKKVWIDNIVNICRKRNVPVFMKESLRDLMGRDFIQEFPKELAPTD